MKTTGRRIQARREQLGWSREDLAKRLKRSRMTIWRLENDKTQIRAGALKVVAKTLRMHLTDLIA